jgi:glycerophosphoryl diester phosphodiesterase
MILGEDDPSKAGSRSTNENRFRARLRGAEPGRPLIVAHRGDSFHAPENTLEAARLGNETGADAWELDVQLTRDGTPIVIHDESLIRTTNVASRFAGDPREVRGFLVAEFDLDEILALDAGSWFVRPEGGLRTSVNFGTLGTLDTALKSHYASGDVRIPTLVEALSLTAELDWLINVELKSFPNADSRLIDAVVHSIEATSTAERVLVSSFDHADVARVARRRPDLATGVLTTSPLFEPHTYVRRHVLADCYHPSTLALGAGSEAYQRRPSSATLRAGDLAEARASGVPVLVYTVNDATPDGLATHLVGAGVTGLFTDDPRGMRALFNDGKVRAD